MTIARHLHALDAHRASFSRQLDGLSDAVVHASPAPGAWSLAQLAEHFVRVDSGLDLSTAGPIERATSGLSRLRSRAGRSVLERVLALPVRIPAPRSASAVMPSESPRWADVRDAWDELRAGWQDLADADPAQVAYRHPIAGPLRLDDALAFLLAHHRHHDAQVRRTLAQLGLAPLGTRTPLARRTTRVSPTVATTA